ncbi:MAG TPA: O-antigen ligase family protein [Bryobacteraceae bacterium]|nr:O-antigen ligase family protein [Bryobacteraceae bacterium]
MSGVPIYVNQDFLPAQVRVKPAVAVQNRPLVWLMSLCIFFFPIQFPAGSINIAPSDIFLALALIVCLFRLRFVPAAWSLTHAALILVFLGAAGVSVYLHGTMSSYVLVKIVGLLALFASYLTLTTAAGTWREIRRFMRIFIVAVSIHCLFAVVALKVGYSAAWLNYGDMRVSGMYLDPNAFGGLVLVALLMQAGSYMGGRSAVPGLLGGAVTIALVAGLFFTLSRSAWIGFTFGFILVSILRPRLWVISAVLALAITGGTYLWVQSHLSAKNEELIARQDTTMERIEQIRQAIPMFVSHPIRGVGLGEFDLRSDPAGYHPLIIHNTTVWILTELGLLGFSIYIAFVAWFFWRGSIALKQADAQAKPLVVGLLGAHAGMLGLSTGIEVLYQRHWWFVMAMLACAAIAAARDLAFRREFQYED